MPAVQPETLIDKLAADRLPVRQEKAGSVPGAILTIIVGAGLAAAMLLSNLPSDSPGYIIVVCFGLLFVLAGSAELARRQVIEIDGQAVHYYARSLLGPRRWDEPLANYRGLLFSTRYISGSEHRQGYDLFEVTLEHDQPRRHIILGSARYYESGLRQKWEAACRLLSLPALEKDGDRVVARSPRELDQPVQLPAGSDTVAPPLTGTTPPPEITLAETPEGTALSIKPANPLSQPAWLVFFGFMILGMAVNAVNMAGNLGGTQPLLPRYCYIAAIHILPLLLIGSPLYLVVWLTLREKKRYLITAKEFRVLAPEKPNRFASQPAREIKLPLTAIERITVGERDGKRAVLLTGDYGTIPIGHGLKKAGMEWLKNYLLARIAAR